MTDRPSLTEWRWPAASTRPTSVLLDRLAGDRDAGRVGLAGEPAGGEVDDERIDRDPGAALGGVDREADRLLGGVEIDHDAGLDAARALVAEAEHLDACGCGRGSTRRPSSSGTSRAIRQQILVEPTSSTETTEGRRGIGRRDCSEGRKSFIRPPYPFFRALSRCLRSSARGLRAFLGQAEDQPARQAHVDRRDLAREDAVPVVERDGLDQRVGRDPLRAA